MHSSQKYITCIQVRNISNGMYFVYFALWFGIIISKLNKLSLFC